VKYRKLFYKKSMLIKPRKAKKRVISVTTLNISWINAPTIIELLELLFISNYLITGR
jgi:hypothetical protein